jgi:hypothetical protein
MSFAGRDRSVAAWGHVKLAVTTKSPSDNVAVILERQAEAVSGCDPNHITQTGWHILLMAGVVGSSHNNGGVA